MLPLGPAIQPQARRAVRCRAVDRKARHTPAHEAARAVEAGGGEAAGLRLEGRAYWAHELGDTVATLRSSLFGVPFATRTSRLGRDGAVLGVSLTGPVAEGVQLSLSYTGDLRPGATAQMIAAGLQARW
ncbi:autotransporter outer membrane beta-barrel domain-containing protein [Methylobacterium sp. J-088]|uniref:autotransporter domain-containing protein n=1 Tax=Methylobacterium sp. J-088 TaxID=2836664 RepID=UPI001FBB4CC0|nr:autotransporter domain-containing protein [Methylobacterium sp. J-088]MCJ2061921.1 autotransporter outer membrane beta-barrel domain-containing protein [Methylobacterium sp. J-088]